MAGGADPSRAMDIEAHVAVGALMGLARVKPDAVPYDDPSRPLRAPIAELALHGG